mmetsp:Transcript_79637/g.215376  ORF Transcript_79637/g.215376 Transcript_79637/m.215376 type:complete len:210 (+) Transcript_79637:33-662(+)
MRSVRASDSKHHNLGMISPEGSGLVRPSGSRSTMRPSSSTPWKTPSITSVSDTRKRTSVPISTSRSLTLLLKAGKPPAKKVCSSAPKLRTKRLRTAATSKSSVLPVTARKDVAGHTGRLIKAISSLVWLMLTPVPMMMPSRRPLCTTARASTPAIFCPLATTSLGHFMLMLKSARGCGLLPEAHLSASTTARDNTLVTLGALRLTKSVG